MRKLFISVLAVVLGAALIYGATMAWFTDTETVTASTFTAGTVNISDVGISGLTPAEQNNINPGDTIAYDYTLTNTGSKAIKLQAVIDITFNVPNLGTGGTINPDVIDLNLTGDENWHITSQNFTAGNLNSTTGTYRIIAEYVGAPLGTGFVGVIPGTQLDGTYAAASDDNNKITLNVSALLKGAETTNEYQGASIVVGGNVYAIQAANNAEWPAFDAFPVSTVSDTL